MDSFPPSSRSLPPASVSVRLRPAPSSPRSASPDSCLPPPVANLSTNSVPAGYISPVCSSLPSPPGSLPPLKSIGILCSCGGLPGLGPPCLPCPPWGSSCGLPRPPSGAAAPVLMPPGFSSAPSSAPPWGRSSRSWGSAGHSSSMGCFWPWLPSSCGCRCPNTLVAVWHNPRTPGWNWGSWRRFATPPIGPLS